MTEDDLDVATAQEAMRRAWSGGDPTPLDIAILAARLARENWRPVDPDLIEARELAATAAKSLCWDTYTVERVRSGENSDCWLIDRFLAAIKRGRELERGQ